MSSTNKTANLKMHSWVRTDPVVCEDFNENFNKIDAAIGDMRASYGGCEIYVGEYTGTGTLSHSLTFPKLPVFLIVLDPHDTYVSRFSGGPVIVGMEFLNFLGTAASTISVSGTTITLTGVRSGSGAVNTLNMRYHYLALAPAKR